MRENRGTIIEEAAKKIAKGVKPHKIILFGSSAAQTISKGCDIDLLIIKPSDQRRDERDQEVRKLLSDIIYPMDIFVYTPEEVAKYKDLPGSFIGKIMRTGKTLYESK